MDDVPRCYKADTVPDGEIPCGFNAIALIDPLDAGPDDDTIPVCHRHGVLFLASERFLDPSERTGPRVDPHDVYDYDPRDHDPRWDEADPTANG